MEDFDITQETDAEISVVTGRNGCKPLAAVRVWGGCRSVFVDAIGVSDRTLNAGFSMDAASFTSLCKKLKEI